MGDSNIHGFERIHFLDHIVCGTAGQVDVAGRENVRVLTDVVAVTTTEAGGMDGVLDGMSDRHVQAISLIEELRERVRAVSSLDDFRMLNTMVLDLLGRFLSGEQVDADPEGTLRSLAQLGPGWRERYYRGWMKEVDGALRRMRAAGDLPAATDIDGLTSLVVTAIVGGYVLSALLCEVRPMAAAFDMAMVRLQSGVAGPSAGDGYGLSAGDGRGDVVARSDLKLGEDRGDVRLDRAPGDDQLGCDPQV